MTNTPPPSEPDNDAAQQEAGQPENDTRDYRQVLRDLIEIGLGQARMLLEEARSRGPTAAFSEDSSGDSTPPATESIADAYVRICSAVRRTIMLAERLADPE